MKGILFSLVIICGGASTHLHAQGHTLTKIWQTDTLLKTPESVLFDEKAQLLYVSNIDGTPDGKDGKGSIGKVAPDGKIIQADWVKGLNAPKGMGLYKGKLYVADLTEVVVIDIAKAQVVQRIPIDNAVFLNDITIDKTGAVYVSDTRTGKVYIIEDNKPRIQLQGLKSPNGLLAVGSDLFVLDAGSLFQMSGTPDLDKRAEGMDPSTDGLELVKPNEFIASCWSGIIYYIDAKGTKTILLDTRAEKINTADIGYDAKKKIVYVPTFYKNHIAAYQLK